MGLILNNKIKKLQKGYPTRTAKEQVEGGVLGGDYELAPGQLVTFGSQAGEYKAVNATASLTSEADVAGIALATNVKLVTEYPGESKDATYKPGEAINLMISGYVAVALTGLSATAIATATDTAPTPGDIENAEATAKTAVKALVAEGNAVECDNTGAFGATGITFDNMFYTGIYEMTGKVVATANTTTATLTDYNYEVTVLADVKYNM